MAIVRLDGANHSKRFLYQCPEHKRHNCSTKDINADYIENVVLDAVVQILNQNSISTHISGNSKGRIAFENGIMSKNQHHLDMLSEQFNAITTSMSKTTNPLLITRFTKQLEDIAEEMERYEAKIKENEENISSISNSDNSLTKEMLMNDRIRAREIIRSMIDKIIDDESSDDIEISFK
ncbi:MAG: hypothetical protein IJR67_00010 [Acholeplasmatales bacterium]|nr:hypothetical protein [Acholeplasmatales bacterium]